MKASLLKITCFVTLVCGLPCYALPLKEGYVECPPILPEHANPVLITDLRGIVLNGGVVGMSEDWDPGISFNEIDVCWDTQSLNEALEKRFLNKPFTKNDIEDLKQIIIDEYVRNGYPLVDICIPPQDITDGILHIGVIESKLNEIRISGNYWFRQSCLRQYLRVEEGEIIDYPLLESDLYWINRNPFRRASIVLQPGPHPGTTDIELKTEERFPLRVFGGVDNRGTIPVGRNRGFVGFNWGNAFGLDHILSFQFTGTEHFDALKGYAGSYNAPLPWHHNLYFYAGYAQVKLKHIDHDFTNKGRNYEFSTRYEIPLIDYNPTWNHGFQIGFDYKKTNNTLNFSDTPVFDNEVQLTQGVFEYWLDAERDWGNLWLNVDFVFSPFRILNHQTSAAYDTLRPGAKPRYLYLNGEVEGTYNLPWYMTFVARAYWQWTDFTLLPSEEFWLGGFDTVRGYYERILAGDSGAILNLELYSPPLTPIQWLDLPCLRGCDFCEILQFLIFFDYGTATVCHRVIPDQRLNRYLIGIGPGLRYYIDDHLEIRADLGFQLHKYRDHKSHSSLCNFSVLLAF